MRALAPGTVFALLDVPRAVLEQRLTQRQGHYMPASQLDSQLATLEAPAVGGARHRARRRAEHPENEPGVTVVDGVQTVEALAAQVAALVTGAVD